MTNEIDTITVASSAFYFSYIAVLHLLMAVNHVQSTYIYNMEQNQPIKSGELRHEPELKEMCIQRKTSTTVMIPI